MIQEKLLRDPIHDLIAFDRNSPGDRVLLAAIDTFEVQRLRRIRQLGMAHMAYHGAEHSRFAHSLGVMHLVRRLLERLTRQCPVDPLSALATMCAGLLHDLGHGPFSHVMEKFFREDHELWTERIILSPETEINRVLRSYSAELPGLVTAHLSGRTEPRWLRALISSQMDADRFDYLLRDSHMTGVKYGIFDLERLLLLLRVSADGEKIVVESKGLLPVEKYLQSRYQMYRQVYFHKTVTAAEAMLMAVMERARELAQDGTLEHPPEGSAFHRLLDAEDLAIADFLALDDAILLGALGEWSRGSDPVLRDLSSRLLTRRLFKSVEIEAEEETDMLFDRKINAARNLLEDHGYDFRYYLRSSKSSDRPYRPYAPQAPDSTIWIQSPADPARLIDVKDLSPVSEAATEEIYTIHRVFFPDRAGDTDIRAAMTEILTR